jgi:hypothetical protein
MDCFLFDLLIFLDRRQGYFHETIGCLPTESYRNSIVGGAPPKKRNGSFIDTSKGIFLQFMFYPFQFRLQCAFSLHFA